MSLKPGWLLRSAPIFCHLTKSVNHLALTSLLVVPGFPGAVFISDSALFHIPLEMKPLNVFQSLTPLSSFLFAGIGPSCAHTCGAGKFDLSVVMPLPVLLFHRSRKKPLCLPDKETKLSDGALWVCRGSVGGCGPSVV